MATVIIEGSTSPSAFLARGERVEVQRTKDIDKLIKRGFVVVVDDYDNQDAPEPASQPEPPKAPSKGASKADWQEWLASQEPPVEFDPDDTRDELVDKWEAHVAESGEATTENLNPEG